MQLISESIESSKLRRSTLIGQSNETSQCLLAGLPLKQSEGHENSAPVDPSNRNDSERLEPVSEIKLGLEEPR